MLLLLFLDSHSLGQVQLLQHQIRQPKGSRLLSSNHLETDLTTCLVSDGTADTDIIAREHVQDRRMVDKPEYSDSSPLLSLGSHCNFVLTNIMVIGFIAFRFARASRTSMSEDFVKVVVL